MALGMALKTFRKLSTNKSFCSYKRFLYLTSVMNHPEVEQALATEDNITETNTKKGTKKHKNRRSVKHDEDFNEQQTPVILNFFNHCDHVTLKKFLGVPTKIKQFKECLNLDVCERRETFVDIESFLERTSISKSHLPTLYNNIKKFELSERKTFGLQSIVPKFPVQLAKNVKYTVALDLFMNSLNWAVMNKSHQLVDVGTKTLFEKQYIYSPVQHHEMVQDIVNTLPPSTFYVFCSNIPRKKKTTQTYQTTMEALLKVSLNHKMDFLLNRTGKKLDQSRIGNNYVYQVKMSELGLFYDVISYQELLDLRPIFNRWLTHNDGPLQGVETFVDFDMDITDSLIKCILLADAACRCLNKDDNQFPHAYFPPAS